MRRYETICIADPDVNEENRAGLFDRIKNLIAQEKGIIADFDEWGNRQLAYEIRKKTRGYYVCINYGGTGELVTELERNFRLDDRILKFMTILLEKDIDPEILQQEKDVAEAGKTEAKETSSTPAKKDDDSAEADTKATAGPGTADENDADENDADEPDQEEDTEESQVKKEEK